MKTMNCTRALKARPTSGLVPRVACPGISLPNRVRLTRFAALHDHEEEPPPAAAAPERLPKGSRVVADTSDEESNLPDDPLDLDEEMSIPQKPSIQDLYDRTRHAGAYAPKPAARGTAGKEHITGAGGIPGPESSERLRHMAEAEADVTKMKQPQGKEHITGAGGIPGPESSERLRHMAEAEADVTQMKQPRATQPVDESLSPIEDTSSSESDAQALGITEDEMGDRSTNAILDTDEDIDGINFAFKSGEPQPDEDGPNTKKALEGSKGFGKPPQQQQHDERTTNPLPQPPNPANLGAQRDEVAEAAKTLQRLAEARRAYTNVHREQTQVLTQLSWVGRVWRIFEVANGRAAAIGLFAAWWSEVRYGQSVLSQLLGRFEGSTQVEFSIPEARSAVLWVVAAMVMLTMVESALTGHALPRGKILGLGPNKQLWAGRAAMTGFAALVLYETIHSNMPVFPFLYLFGH